MRKAILLMCMLWTIVSAAFAQTRQVTGKVVDKSGEALIGVSVLVKGTSTGASTDVNGSFKINVPTSGNPVLIFKYLGYKNREVVVGRQTQLNVRLEEDATSLDEVVVVGYGTQKRRDLTGAVTSVSGETVRSNPVSSVAEAIAGRMAGVQVSTTDGAPGAEIVIRVRGGGSVTQDNSPLYIVDGFPVDNINNIATTDIETIDVLKDASSTAIYGARGANGVVIVTTKSAKGGKTSISYNGFGQARTFPRELDVLTPYQFALAQYEYAALRGTTSSDFTNFTKYFGSFDDLELYKNQKGTNWQDKLFGSPAWSQQHNLSVTGGTDKTKLSLSYTNNKEDGIMIGSGYKRDYFNFKLNHVISDKLKLDFGTRYSNAVTDGAGTSGTSSLRISDGITTRPVNGLADQIVIDPNADADEDYDQFLRSLISPIELAAQDYRKRVDQILNLNTAVSWRIIKPLTYRSEGGIDFRFGNTKRYYGPLTGESRNNGGNLPLGEITDSQGKKFRWANTLNYTFKLNKDHDLSWLVGQEMIWGKSVSTFNRSKYFAENIEPERLFANMTLGTMDRMTTSEYPEESLFSLFTRANYQYKNRYLLALTMRGDNSSLFAKGNRLGVFPAASAAWRISEEKFMKGLPVISDLKVRASYGEAGNNRIQRDMFRQTWAISSFRPIGFGDVPQSYWVASNTSILVNPKIKWETTITRNAGIDFGFFRNKLSGTLDLYKNTTKDLLVQSAIPVYNGYPYELRNIGQTSNKGVELTLNGAIIRSKNFELSGNFNIGINRTNIDKLDGVNERLLYSNWAGTDLKGQDDYRMIVGQPLGLMYGYITDGYYTVDDFESYDAATKTYKLKEGVPNNYGVLGGILGIRPGVLKYKDLDNDGVVDADHDRTIIGNATPKHTGGFGFNGRYKGLDFSTLFNWSYGNDVYNTGKIALNMLYRTSYGNMLNTMNYNNRFRYIDEAGQVVTDLEQLRTMNQNATMWSPFSMGNASPSLHSFAVEDGSFLRLSNITLGYTLPKITSSKVGLSNLRVYGTVYNAFLWTNYSGYDPEANATRNSSYSQLTPGVDYSAYPKSRTFTFGINATF